MNRSGRDRDIDRKGAVSRPLRSFLVLPNQGFADILGLLCLRASLAIVQLLFRLPKTELSALTSAPSLNGLYKHSAAPFLSMRTRVVVSPQPVM